MALSNISDPAAIKEAIDEFDLLGESEFLLRYGFGNAREYLLIYNGNSYPSKAIVGVAHKFQFPQEGPLTSDSFVGGGSTVKPLLESLGYTVQRISENIQKL